MLQGHSALVCSLQLTPHTLSVDERVAAVRRTVSSHRRKRWPRAPVRRRHRDLTAPSDTVWKVVFRQEVCVTMCRRW
ncbi:hypothetical protein BGW80DRAFT_521303 [Lactifluus volemus]|nr:hypothetical protein BGW80DRAFT_521303 [Lactifluus volemus]